MTAREAFLQRLEMVEQMAEMENTARHLAPSSEGYMDVSAYQVLEWLLNKRRDVSVFDVGKVGGVTFKSLQAGWQREVARFDELLDLQLPTPLIS